MLKKISRLPGSNCQVGPSPIWHVYIRTRARASIPCCARVIYFITCVFECFNSIVWWCPCDVSVPPAGYEYTPFSLFLVLAFGCFWRYEDAVTVLRDKNPPSGIIYMAHSNTCLEVAKVYLLLCMVTYTCFYHDLYFLFSENYITRFWRWC